ncbi:GIY-YIG nuclease family protein [Adhaeribacter soli]|uniref:GIY-YIG nuclease family protein n=1 Tax=Adhaeribacter soli TaxID=2607655 RepID=A0A5N1IX12_9BACT|nr:GIY-YIG nuclease family protein [Adhaeribacter soli]KAA9333686.1 GIY-YIG nuclease family protein [Adhaeribacter soli]
MGNYFTYITTNAIRTVLYIGITNDLERRMTEHFENKGKPNTFAGKYGCHFLIYFERFPNAKFAIEREKELKKWSRVKKENLIRTMNPNWQFLNEEIKERCPVIAIAERNESLRSQISSGWYCHLF